MNYEYENINFLWLDLETTGVNVDKDEILEIGGFLTDNQFRIIPEDSQYNDFNFVVRMTPVGLGRIQENEIVYEMHKANGLLMESISAELKITEVDKQVCAWLDSHNDGKEIRLAGTGIAFFDRHMIRYHMPNLESRLHSYKMLDIGHVRRYLETIGEFFDIKDDSPHRSLPDAYQAWNQAKQFRTIIL